jgi:hypothetical protein
VAIGFAFNSGGASAAEAFTTSNGGSSWSSTSLGVANTDTLSQVSCPSTSYCEWVGWTGDGHWQSFYSTATSGLGSFTADGNPSSTLAKAVSVSCWASNECMAMAPIGNAEVAEGATGGGTTSWTNVLASPPPFQQFNAPNAVSCQSFSSGGECYATTATGIMRSTDTGSHWASVLNMTGGTSNQYYSNAASCVGVLTCFYVGQDAADAIPQVYHTTSGGATWDAGPMGLAFGPSTLNVVSCATTTTCVTGWREPRR